jgi:hypothetical protein
VTKITFGDGRLCNVYAVFAEEDAKMKTPSKRKRQQLAYAITLRAEAKRSVEQARQALARGRDAVVEASEGAAFAAARAALEGLRAKLSAAETNLRWHEHVVVTLADNLMQSIDDSTDLREFSMRRSMCF